MYKLYIILPALYFLLLCFFLYLKEGRTFSLPVFISMIYFLSSVSSVILYYSGLYLELKITRFESSLVSVSLFCLLITLTILPFSKLNNVFQSRGAVSKYELIPFRFLKHFGLFMTMLCIMKLVVFIPKIADVITMDISENRIMSTDVDLESHERNNGIFETIVYYGTLLFARFSPLLIFSFFYTIIFYRSIVSRFFLISVIVASLIPVMDGLLLGGRTQITYWILLILANVVLFRKLLTKSFKIQFNFVFIICLLMFYTYNSAVVTSRWGANEQLNNLVIYFGQPFLYFNDFMIEFENHGYTFQRIFPPLQLLGAEKFSLSVYRDVILNYSGKDIGIFYTFLGDLLVDVGLFGALIYVVSFNRVSYHVKMSLINSHKHAYFVIIILLIQIPIHGIFYYSFWRMDMFFYSFFSIVFFFVLHKTNRENLSSSSIL